MTDTSPTPSTPSSGCGSRCGGWRGCGKVALLVLISALAGAALSHAVHWPFWGHHWGHHGPGFMMGGKFDAERAEKGIERMVGHLAGEVKASDEQRQKITDIAKAAVKDLAPMRESMQAARKQAHELLAAATIDRAAVEKFRAEHVTQMDAMSKRMSLALADAAEVLTPEQRKQLADRMAAHMDGRGSHGGWFGSRD